MANPTSIYIDLVPGYKNLSSCAEAPLSSLVRNMWNGCGDNSELTSFSCFCTDSYSKFSWDISTAVVASCGLVLGPVQATSAVSVFHNYCANGTTQLVTATATTSGTASITNSPVTSIPKFAPRPTESGLTSSAARLHGVFSLMVGIIAVQALFL